MMVYGEVKSEICRNVKLQTVQPAGSGEKGQMLGSVDGMWEWMGVGVGRYAVKIRKWVAVVWEWVHVDGVGGWCELRTGWVWKWVGVVWVGVE